METRIQIQSTPNPNALKFVLNTPVKTDGKVTYKSASECQDNALAKELFSVPHVHEVYFFDNYITVTQDGSGEWDELEGKIQPIILEKDKDQDPNLKEEEPKMEKPVWDKPEIKKINEIFPSSTLKLGSWSL